MQHKMRSLVRLMHFIMKIKKVTRVSCRIWPNLGDSGLDHDWVPHDVKEGHFAVLAGNGEAKTRFVVSLHQLENPEFVRLLDQAQEEYGFIHGGLLIVPCSPEQLQKILDDGI